MADELLFNVSNDDLLISIYQKQGRTRDDLPYTDEIEQIHAAIVGLEYPCRQSVPIYQSQGHPFIQTEESLFAVLNEHRLV